nr:MAG TPA: Head Tail Connector Protein [Caudoviricetes sp.]
MAYADYDFYTKSFFGNVVPESDFIRFAERASDFLDTLTFDRLTDGLPTPEKYQKRIKKAVCAVAEIYYQLDLAQKQALASASGTSATTDANGTTTGIITSKSSGSESISYATAQQTGAAAKEWSAVYSAAGDTKAANKLLSDAVMPYLTGVVTDDGTPLLYAGL